jgi:hypothetical protein
MKIYTGPSPLSLLLDAAGGDEDEAFDAESSATA